MAVSRRRHDEASVRRREFGTSKCKDHDVSLRVSFERLFPSTKPDMKA